MPGIRRWPVTLVTLSLAFLLPAEWSLGQLVTTPGVSIGPFPLTPTSSWAPTPAPTTSPPSPPTSSPPSPATFSPPSPPTSSWAPTTSPPSPSNLSPVYHGIESPRTSSSFGSTVKIILAFAAAVFVLLCGSAIYCFKKKRTHPENDEEKSSTGMSSRVSSLFYKTGDLKRSFGTRFSYSEVNAATNGFTEELGRGAFGVVYKGRLADGTDVAVKKLHDRQGSLQDFLAEVRILGRINQSNLVALHGFCYEQNQPFVVYEYVANGSLDKWIFEKAKKVPGYVMPWKLRVSVLKGTAKALAYLHEDLQIGQAIIHLDLKPENILLDDQFVPKVADFGLAKLLGSKISQTLAAGGTTGYMAPEVLYGAATPKMDVYGFGVVLLEVLSGRRVLTPTLSPDSMFLPAWALRKVLDGKPLDVIDPLVRSGEFDNEEAIRLVMTALLCLPRDPDERPRMSEVLRMIEGSTEPIPVPPSLQSFLEMAERMILLSLQHGQLEVAPALAQCPSGSISIDTVV